MDDPKRFYATLRVKPVASGKEIAAAYRRLAKVLHPDVPVTGSAAAFMRVHAAYAVLQDPLERARYDRMAREGGGADGTIWQGGWNEAGWAAGRASTPGAWATAHAGEADADLADLVPQPTPPRPRVRWFRLSTLAGSALVLLTLGAIGFGASELLRPRPVSPATAAPARRSAEAAAPPTEDPGPPAADARGAASYVLPADGQATFWRFDRGEGHYRPAGRLEPFTVLAVLRLVPGSGMAEVRLADQRLGYVEAHRIAAGDGEAARRADCVYNAGAPPRNGEMLSDGPAAEAPREAGGGRPVTVDNNAELPAVFALRSGATVAAVVYVQAHGTAVIDGVPPGRYRPEYAIGDLWSRACFRFAAGMRTQRLASEAPLAGHYAIPDPAAADVPGLAVGQAAR